MLDSALKIGIIRLSSLGDIISTMVFLEFIRTKFARSGRKIEITFIVDTQFRGIVADSAMIDRIIDLPLRASKKNKKLLFEIYKKTRQLGRFDILIDAQGLLKSALIGTLIKKKKFVGFSADSAREKIASFFYTKKATIAYNEHILKRQYELFKTAFDEVNWESDFRLKMLDSRNRAMDSSPKAKAKIAQILAPFKANKKILFLCETSKADKEFSLTSFYALAEGLWSDYKDARIFLIWDKKEAEIRAFGEKDSRFCVLPHLDFDEIKALLGNMDLVIGGDTGITHSAWAMRVPSVTIYISTNMKRFALEGDKHFSIAVSNSPLELHSADFEIFGDFADLYPVSSPKISKNHESQTENPSVVDSAKSQNLGENSEKIAESDPFCHSTTFCHSERSEESKKINKRFVDSSVASLPQNDKNSVRVAESINESQGGLPRRFCESARNDENLDSSLRASHFAQNDKIGAENDKNSVRVAESSIDSVDSQNLQGGLPRRFCESTRKDEILDSSLRKCSAQNDNLEVIITQILRFIKKKVLL